MAEIEPYVWAASLLDAEPLFGLPIEWLRRDELFKALEQSVISKLSARGLSGKVPHTHTVTHLIQELTSDNGIEVVDDPIAGSYYKVSPDRMRELIGIYAQSDVIVRKTQQIGERFLRDVFDAYLVGMPQDRFFELENTDIPASDRIVTLNHNQTHIVEAPLDTLINNLDEDNGLPDTPGVRERLLGQLRAGRELIRSGEFKAYALYITLIHGLVELAARYKDTLIGAAAGKLMELLIETIFKAK